MLTGVRVVIDTSVMVASCRGTGGSLAVRGLWRQGHLVLVVSDPILAEYERKLRDPRLAIPVTSVVEILHDASDPARSVVVSAGAAPRTNRSPDPADNWFLDAADDGDATALITLDKADLLSLEMHLGTHILTPARFLGVFREYLGPFLGLPERR